jgi:hypothetical protein
MINDEKTYIVSNKGLLLMAFYESLQKLLPEKELSMELWTKFFNRFIELGGKI